jgi:hypothetical protein
MAQLLQNLKHPNYSLGDSPYPAASRADQMAIAQALADVATISNTAAARAAVASYVTKAPSRTLTEILAAIPPATITLDPSSLLV